MRANLFGVVIININIIRLHVLFNKILFIIIQYLRSLYI
jgi:hypothetical protein